MVSFPGLSRQEGSHPAACSFHSCHHDQLQAGELLGCRSWPNAALRLRVCRQVHNIETCPGPNSLAMNDSTVLRSSASSLSFAVDNQDDQLRC